MKWTVSVALVTALTVPAGALLGTSAATANAAALAVPSHVFGVSVTGLPTNRTAMNSFSRMVGRNVNVADYYDDFTDPNFNANAATAIINQGAVPMLAWEAQAGAAVIQPGFRLETLIDGSHDVLLTTWAREIAAWGKPLMLRFAPEMNGNWNPYSEGVNGNTAGQYVRAWRHVHALFVAAHASNVKWVWNPNVDYLGSTSLKELFPGDAYVDYVGLDGYNWGTSQRWSSWQTPQQVFNPTIADIRRFTAEPIILTEVSSAEQGGSKAQWINQFFAWLKRTPTVTGFVWFEFNKEADWLVESSPASKTAFIADLNTL